MKAAVLHELGQVPRWEDFDQPVPADGEDLIRVTAAPLNNIDKVRACRHALFGPVGRVRRTVVCRAGDHRRGRTAGRGAGPVRLPVRHDGGGTRAGRGRTGAASSIPAAVLCTVAWCPSLNPGLSAWLALGWRCRVEPGQTVLVLGATGVTGKLAVQAARHFGAGHVIAAGRNQEVLDLLLARGRTRRSSSASPRTRSPRRSRPSSARTGATSSSIISGAARPRCCSVGADALRRPDPGRSECGWYRPARWPGRRSRCLAEALRSGGLEILGQGTGKMPPLDVITGMLGELLDLLAAGTVRIDVDEVPLSAVSDVWRRDQRGRRPVFRALEPCWAAACATVCRTDRPFFAPIR